MIEALGVYAWAAFSSFLAISPWPKSEIRFFRPKFATLLLFSIAIHHIRRVSALCKYF